MSYLALLAKKAAAPEPPKPEPAPIEPLPVTVAGLALLAVSIWLAARNANPSAMEQTCPVEPDTKA